MNPFGPILRFELVRIARRQRLTLNRCMFVIVLAGIAAFVYYVAYKEQRGPLPLRTLASVTEGIMLGLFGLLFAVAALFTPQMTGDAITNEKERRTLPFLLLTDLTSHEIILGKLASRLLQIGLLLLGAVPVLVALQFFGGVEPMLVLLGAAALITTLWSIGALSILSSVYARNPKAAAQRTGQVVAGYVVGMMITGQLLSYYPWVGGWPSGATFTLSDWHEWMNIGNPIWAVEQISRGGGAVFTTFGNYMLFHTAFGALFVAWAIARLRPVAAEIPLEGPPPVKGDVNAHRRPPVSRRPVLWKMLYCDFRPYKTPLGRFTTRVVYLLSFAPVFVVLVIAIQTGSRRAVPESMMVYTRLVGTLVLCGLLLHVAAQAAGSIGRERNKQTLDELLLTDLTTDEILRQKWLGSILTMRWMLIWIAVHWAIAIAAGALHPLAALLLTVLWVTYLCFVASLGMYNSARVVSAQKSTMWTTLMGFLLGALPLAVGMILLWLRPPPASPSYVFFLVLSPPAALGLGAFSVEDFRTLMLSTRPAWLNFAVVGIAASAVIHLILAVAFWRGARRWFPRTTGRE